MVELKKYPWLIPTYTAIVDTYHHGKSHHAYLFIHRGDVGQQVLVDALAKLFICANALEQKLFEPCGHCTACKALHFANPDLIELEAVRNNIPVDSVRTMIEQVASHPSVSANNTVIIYGANHLNTASANAMLKSLEEPATRTKYLITLNADDFILPTIRSRCMVLNLPQPNDQELVEFCQQHHIYPPTRNSYIILVGSQPDKILAMHERKFGDEIAAICQALYQTIMTLELAPLKDQLCKYSKDVAMYTWTLMLIRTFLAFVLEVKVYSVNTNSGVRVLERFMEFSTAQEVATLYLQLLQDHLDYEATVALIHRITLLEKQIRNFTPQLGGEKSLEAIAYKVSAEICLWRHESAKVD